MSDVDYNTPTRSQDTDPRAEPDAARPVGNADAPPFDPYPPLYTPMQRRGIAAVWLLVALALIGVAIWLSPEARGYGTHRQLGMGKCGMLVTSGLPCPTCGMTTAFAFTVRGRLISAFWSQPAGLVFALLTIASVPFAAWMLWTGKRLPFRPERFSATAILFVSLLILIGGWGAKMFIGLADGTFPDRP